MSPARTFSKAPGETVMGPSEMLVEIAIPVPKGRTVFKKLGRRKAMTLSIMNVAVQLVMDGDKVGLARIALGVHGSQAHTLCPGGRPAGWREAGRGSDQGMRRQGGFRDQPHR